MVNSYRECFAENTDELGICNTVKMKIKLTDDKSIVYRPYRLSCTERKEVQQIVHDLIKNNKTGDMRLCVYYRALNAKTIKDSYPFPHLDDCLEQLRNSTVFTSLDTASDYHQIQMNDESIAKTAFVTPDRHLEYLKIPFGLTAAPYVFFKMIKQVLGSLSVVVFMDDILIPTDTIETGFKILEQVLQTFRNANLTLKLSKCQFFMSTINYLGHEISSKSIKPNCRKIKAVQEFPKPTNIHQIRQFIGLTSFFRKFIQNYTIIAKPLTSVTKKNVNFIWDTDQENAFQTLKGKLVERPILAVYDSRYGTAVTKLHTDASKSRLGGIYCKINKITLYDP